MGIVRVIASGGAAPGGGEPYEWIRRVVENRREVERLELIEPGGVGSPESPGSMVAPTPSGTGEGLGWTFGLWPDAVWLGIAIGAVAAIWVVWRVHRVAASWWRGGVGDPGERAFRRIAAETRLDLQAVRAARELARARGLRATTVLLCPSVRGGRL